MLQEILTQPFLLIFLLIFIFFTKWLFLARNNRRLPPSPSKLPVLGNLHQLGTHPHRSLRSLAQKYGPVMLLHLGKAPTLVVSSAEAAREIMTTLDLIFANRPDSSIARRLLYDYKDMSLVPYGEYWRQVRSICVIQLLGSKRVQTFRSIREEETATLVKKIEQSCSSFPVDLSEIFSSLTINVICRAAFGKKYSEGSEEKKFKKLLDEFVAVLGVCNIGDFISWLAWINYFNGLNARVEKVFREFDHFLNEVIDDHMGRKTVGITKDQTNFVDVLLEIQKNSTDGVSMDRDNIKAIVLDMFAAGSDTTYTALEWTMTELLRQPRVLKEVQQEIRSISGSKPNVTEDDVEKMHYLKAVIKESLRLHPPIPLLVPRESTQDVRVQGYDISAKTRVIINGWAIGRDPTIWEEPEEFRPERFLNSSIDYKGHDFRLIPFGAGRRGCPGIAFATAVIEIALASFLHKFDWEIHGVAKAEDLDVKEAPGVSVRRQLPLIAVATPHLP